MAACSVGAAISRPSPVCPGLPGAGRNRLGSRPCHCEGCLQPVAIRSSIWDQGRGYGLPRQCAHWLAMTGKNRHPVAAGRWGHRPLRTGGEVHAVFVCPGGSGSLIHGRVWNPPLRTGTKLHTIPYSPVGPVTRESGRLITAPTARQEFSAQIRTRPAPPLRRGRCPHRPAGTYPALSPA